MKDINHSATLKDTSILIVEDEKLVAWDIEESLRDMGLEFIDTATSLPAAREFLEKNESHYSLVILDIKLGETDGAELIPDCISLSIPVLVITGYSNFQDKRTHVIYKPFSMEELKHKIHLLCNGLD